MDWQGNKFPFITNEKSHDESSRVTHDRVDAIEPEKKNVIIEHSDGNANRESVNSARGPTIPPTPYKRLERTKGIAVGTDSESERNFSSAESNQVKSLAKSDAHEHPDLRADHEYVYSNRKDSKASCRSKKNFYIFDTRTSYRDKGFRDCQLESRSQSIFYKEVMDIMSTDPCDTKRYRRSILFQDSKSVASRPLNIRLDKPNDSPSKIMNEQKDPPKQKIVFPSALIHRPEITLSNDDTTSHIRATKVRPITRDQRSSSTKKIPNSPTPYPRRRDKILLPSSPNQRSKDNDNFRMAREIIPHQSFRNIDIMNFASLFVLTLIRSSSALIGYDCGGSTLNLTTFSTVDKPRCEYASNRPVTQSVDIQLLQMIEYNDAPVLQCKERSIERYYTAECIRTHRL